MYQINQINSSTRLGLLQLDLFRSEYPNTSKRDVERAATLYLLDFLYPKQKKTLQYTDSGKPYLENESYGISISHSHNLLAIFVDNKNSNTGIDIELVTDKVLKIRDKFLSANEKSFIPEKNVFMHLVAWCVKETLYKIYGKGKVDFINNLFIESFTEQERIISAKCHVGQSIFTTQIQVKEYGEYIITYPINENIFLK